MVGWVFLKLLTLLLNKVTHVQISNFVLYIPVSVHGILKKPTANRLQYLKDYK